MGNTDPPKKVFVVGNNHFHDAPKMIVFEMGGEGPFQISVSRRLHDQWRSDLQTVHIDRNSVRVFPVVGMECSYMLLSTTIKSTGDDH